MGTSRDGCRRVINLVVCLLTITAFIPPYPLFADEAIDGEFAQLQSEIRAFNERAELHYYQFLNAYENLSRALAELEAAYASGDESRISAALAEYSAAKQEFQRSVAQAYALRSEGEELANKTMAFINRAVEAGMLPPALAQKAEENYALLMQRTAEAFAMLQAINSTAEIKGEEDIAALRSEMLRFSSFMNSTLKEYNAIAGKPQISQPMQNATLIKIKPIKALGLKGKELVNPEVNSTLSEIEARLELAKRELEAVEATYQSLLIVKNYTQNLSYIREELATLREATEEEITQEDIERINATEEELRALLSEINSTVAEDFALASQSLENLTRAKFELQALYKLVHHISYINASHSMRVQRLEQEIVSLLDRIDVDFKYVWYNWYLLGEDIGIAGELKSIENELKGIETNLGKASKGKKKTNPYQETIDATVALEEEVSSLRNYVLTERKVVKALVNELRQFGKGWVKIYRELIELVPPMLAPVLPEYLNETVDARITPEIEALAANLSYDLSKIHAFVKENVSYEAYLGSARGSVWTLSARAGNAFDQASLLIALLRASQIPARYVQGWIELSKEQLIELVGGRNVTVNSTSYAMSFEEAIGVIDAVAMPYRITTDGVQLEHVWVEAALPSNASFNYTEWSFENLTFEELNRTLIGEGVAIPAIRSVKLIQPGYVWQRLDPILENYTIISAINYAEIPQQYRHRVQIRTSDGIDSGVIPLPLLAKERIILKFEPASGSDASLLGDTSLYRLLDAGGTSWYVGYYMWGYWVSGPTYAYVIPKLIIGNETVAEGYVTRLGSWQTLIFNFSYADRWLQDYKGYLVGDMLSITLSPAYEPPERITEEAGKVTSLYQRYNATRNASEYDDFVAQMLYTTGIAYYAASDKTTELGEEVFFTKRYNPVTRGDYVHRGAEYWELWQGFWGFYDVYAYYMPGGPSHDHRVNIIQSYSRIGQREGMVAFNLLAGGFAGSGWESQSIYALYNTTAVSTTYILAYAQNMSMPIYTINSTNYNEEIPKLNQPDWIKDRVRALAQAGYIVVIPEAWVTINQWRGTGWAVIDPYTGLGAYIIAGSMYYANTTAPPQILSGGWGTVPVNMSLLWEKFRNYSEKLKEQLGIANITKDEARAEAAEKWFSIAVGSAITFILVGGVPFTASAMLALMPLSVAALLLGEDVFVGAIISAINNRINLILLGLSISLAVYHTYLAIDPEGEIYVLGY